ncbi:deoxynucleoside kinase [Sporosarcina sp. 6E9]|uniref:deoxynucleoside kinase n=1 Tax=Sporosarcina sp. 6E9 TaxID=2819235 RepID=UPI001B317A07|nr:deoxynucleoside kinase [Sporosarcina sp. 6E9]
MNNLREKYGIPKNAVITIAGTVGVGKSTMTQALANALDFKTSFENVDENPYLDRFYDNFEKWSFHLQIYFLAERFKEQKRIFESGGGFIQDRSIYEDTGIFAKMHADNGTMDPVDYDTYTDLFEAMVMTPYFPHPNLLIYLDGSMEDILQRIEERGRTMEKQTSITYWEEMHGRYEKWINSFSACPVLRLNINDYDLIEDPHEIESIVGKIGNALS